jgi:hypothetical protein
MPPAGPRRLRLGDNTVHRSHGHVALHTFLRTCPFRGMQPRIRPGTKTDERMGENQTWPCLVMLRVTDLNYSKETPYLSLAVR